MYEVVLSRRYKTAHKRVSRHKDFDQSELDLVVNTLASGEKLDPKRRDHQLTGEYKDYRECHIKNDILLMYQKRDNVLVLLLVDLGSHDALFK
ncbi:MAG: type II toxin-antitoxin system YafQ family toxin [bacterium]|nr:type II toxin-antitoxin system YafQ family toxin [bacterium]